LGLFRIQESLEEGTATYTTIFKVDRWGKVKKKKKAESQAEWEGKSGWHTHRQSTLKALKTGTSSRQHKKEDLRSRENNKKK